MKSLVPRLSTLLFLCLATLAAAQTMPVKVPKGANHFVYTQRGYDGEATVTDLYVSGNLYRVADRDTAKGPFIPGYSTEESYFDLTQDSIYTFTAILGEDGTRRDTFLTAAPYRAMDIHFDTAKVGRLTRYTCSVNSNKLEFYVQDYPQDLTPITYYGRFPGVLVSFWRNGQCRLQLDKAERVSNINFQLSTSCSVRVTPRELNRIKRERMVITTRIFDSVQLSWGRANSRVEGSMRADTPYDSVLHFAGGTLAMKRIRLPKLPAHYQTFVEIHQRSNGDAYDRTGSLFVIPDWNDITFFHGMNGSPDSLPIFTDRQGGRYQGIRIEGDTNAARPCTYEPPLELVRFFTSFGVGHFNDRVQLDGLEWQQENYYKQEVTELAPWLQGDDVWVGIWIGNYDKGGHIVTVDLKSYPNADRWEMESRRQSCAKPLFNTCNVLEMAGQNYGRLFATDSLTAAFTVPQDATNLRLRYLTTGHGGWDGGDEFNPKANTLLIDGRPLYTYTPWRCDCGRYREWNPVSGNFWNGTSSSDYSRSGWCPGTATQPVYFDLGFLTPGRHTITVAIPQGKDEEGSFSHWCVSGALLFER